MLKREMFYWLIVNEIPGGFKDLATNLKHHGYV